MRIPGKVTPKPHCDWSSFPIRKVVLAGLLIFAAYAPKSSAQPPQRIRIATFNTSLNRPTAGRLMAELRSPNHQQIKQVAAIIQTVRPNIILLNEFDFDASGKSLDSFRSNYLGMPQFGKPPIEFDHSFSAPVNTGVPSGFDFDKDGRTDGPADAFGYGRFPGQYGMAILSDFPVDKSSARTFRQFLWKDMPKALRPIERESGRSFYSDKEWNAFRLSSKSHWDVPIRVGRHRLHLLACHPTPPAFDGPERRNMLRNHDEIRFFTDYLEPASSAYIIDDNGQTGGLPATEAFVILGDLNTDPHDGSGQDTAIRRLLNHPRVNATRTPISRGAVVAAEVQAGANATHAGPPQHDTSDFNDERTGNLRVDYVLPSSKLTVTASGVFWPAGEEEGADLLTASDHRLVWIDVQFSDAPKTGSSPN